MLRQAFDLRRGADGFGGGRDVGFLGSWGRGGRGLSSREGGSEDEEEASEEWERDGVLSLPAL